MLNRDMIQECLAKFNQNTQLFAEIENTDVDKFSIKVDEFKYEFDWEGNFLFNDKLFNYIGVELERFFKAKLNSLDNSNIDAPNHYTLPSGKQLIELLQSDLLTRKEFIGFCKGNVFKYVARYQAKNHREDLEKAKQYLNFLEGLENGQNENE